MSGPDSFNWNRLPWKRYGNKGFSGHGPTRPTAQKLLCPYPCPMGTRLAYQVQSSVQTLREGLDEYRAANPHLVDERGASSPQIGRFFQAHDRCHVVFGLDTTIREEAMADTWTIFGSDIPLREYASYANSPEVKGILSELGWWKGIGQSVTSLPAAVMAWRRARRMTTPWPFWDNETWLDCPLASIRSEHGIELVPSPD